jgi:hypothetical protein
LFLISRLYLGEVSLYEYQNRLKSLLGVRVVFSWIFTKNCSLVEVIGLLFKFIYSKLSLCCVFFKKDVDVILLLDKSSIFNCGNQSIVIASAFLSLSYSVGASG